MSHELKLSKNVLFFTQSRYNQIDLIQQPGPQPGWNSRERERHKYNVNTMDSNCHVPDMSPDHTPTHGSGTTFFIYTIALMGEWCN